jgi:putative transposase
MPKPRSTEEQIINIVRKAEITGRQVCELCRKEAIAAQACYRWRQKDGGLEITETACLR